MKLTKKKKKKNNKNLYFFRFLKRQIYHKQIIGSSLTVMKTQLTYDLKTDDTLQKQN